MTEKEYQPSEADRDNILLRLRDVGKYLGNAVAGYRDGDFRRSAEGLTDTMTVIKAAADEIERLTKEAELTETGALRFEIGRLKDEIERLKSGTGKK